MARCNCSDAKCSCVIVDSATISWEGAGRADNPYRANASSGGGGASGWAPGDLKWTARATVEPGWLVADGSPVARADFPALFEAIGEQFGAGDGATTFLLPDYTGKFMLGADPTHPPATSGGQAEVTLAARNVPGHTHPIDHNHAAATSQEAGQHDHDLKFSATEGSHNATVPQGTDTAISQGASAVLGDGTHTHEVNLPRYTGTSGENVGGSQPVNVLNPYTTAIPLIKT